MPQRNPIFLTPNPKLEQTLKKTAALLGISLSALICKGLEAEFATELAEVEVKLLSGELKVDERGKVIDNG